MSSQQEIEGLRILLKTATGDTKKQIQDTIYTLIGKQNIRKGNDIIQHSFAKACEIGKFRTVAALIRKTLDPNFSAQRNREAMFDMSFQEWASYAVADNSYGYQLEHNPKILGLFIEEAKNKGFYAETEKEWININR